MESCTVFYEGWQMECCGTPFKTGDIVRWLVFVCGRLNSPVDMGKVDYCYEAHTADWTKLLVLEGRVDGIRILYHQYAPVENGARLMVPVDGVLLPAEAVEGFEEPVDGMEVSGYLVEIRNYALRPAQKKDMTFR